MPTISILTATLQLLPKQLGAPVSDIWVTQSLFPSVHITIYYCSHFVANALHSALRAVLLHILCLQNLQSIHCLSSCEVASMCYGRKDTHLFYLCAPPQAELLLSDSHFMGTASSQ